MGRFIHSNPGFPIRFARFIEFPDYSALELCRIFSQCGRKNGLTLASALKEKVITTSITSPNVADKTSLMPDSCETCSKRHQRSSQPPAARSEIRPQPFPFWKPKTFSHLPGSMEAHRKSGEGMSSSVTGASRFTLGLRSGNYRRRMRALPQNLQLRFGIPVE